MNHCISLLETTFLSLSLAAELSGCHPCVGSDIPLSMFSFLIFQPQFCTPPPECDMAHLLEDDTPEVVRGPPIARTGEVFPWDDVR